MARSLLLVASGALLALVVVVVAVLIAVRALSGPSDSQAVRHVDPDEAVVPSAPAAPTAPEEPARVSGDARLTMHNVALVAAPGVTVDVVHMEGALRSRKEGAGIDLEKPDTFDVVVNDAEVRVRAAILQKLAWRVDQQVPGLAGARVALDRVHVRKGHVVQEGTLALGPMKLPFTVTGTLAATAAGDVRVEVVHAHVGAVDTLPLIEALNFDLRKVLGNKSKTPGVKGGEGLSLFVSPKEMETQPRMIGKVRAVRIDEDVVVVLLGAGAEPGPVPGAKVSRAKLSRGKNSLVIAGGHLVLGKMTMNGAVAELVDTDDDALMIDMKDFQRQLFASVCRATPQGVRIHMIDANDVREPRDQRAVGR